MLFRKTEIKSTKYYLSFLDKLLTSRYPQLRAKLLSLLLGKRFIHEMKGLIEELIDTGWVRSDLVASRRFTASDRFETQRVIIGTLFDVIDSENLTPFGIDLVKVWITEYMDNRRAIEVIDYEELCRCIQVVIRVKANECDNYDNLSLEALEWLCRAFKRKNTLVR